MIGLVFTVAEGKGAHENMFVADSIRDAEIADSRNSNRTSMAHGVAFPHMKIAASDGLITREQNYHQAHIENLRIIGELKGVEPLV